MRGKPRTPAYFAVARGIGDHPMFNYGTPAYSWREAWEWLIEQAAYKPRGHRHVRGVFELDRGELCATHREMAAAWRWPRSNVTYFLRRLMAEGMISAESRAECRGRRRRITVCNYDRFQPGNAILAQRVAQSYAQDVPTLPGILPTTPTLNRQDSETGESLKDSGEALNSGKTGDKLASKTAGPIKPRHGARNRKAQVRWFDYGTEEWKEAAEFDRTYRGLETFPRRYADGGRGNWFKERSREEWQDWGRRLSANGRG